MDLSNYYSRNQTKRTAEQMTKSLALLNERCVSGAITQPSFEIVSRIV